jgi:phosphoribosylformimino-5-aminoimidazole carboxamide ribonucleotide (ProFAR) isomerase
MLDCSALNKNWIGLTVLILKRSFQMKKVTSVISYVGKEVFIGIDVHKKTYAVVARLDGEVIKKWTTAADPQGLAQQLLKFFVGATIHTAYEAGFSGFYQMTMRVADK